MKSHQIEFEIHCEDPLGDGPVAIPIDGPELTAGCDGILDIHSLSVADLNLFPYEWGKETVERSCAVQFEPSEAFDPSRPVGTLWMQLHKYTWESTAFPRKFRLYFSVCSGGASSRQMSEGWARPEPVEIAAFPTQRMIRWANPETVRVKYRWLDDQKPHFHPLATPSGRVLTGDAPRDHPWHHGLCIGFTSIECEPAGLKPYAYWGEPGQGILHHTQPELLAGPVWNGFQQHIVYCTHDGQPVFNLDVEARHSAVEHKWDWLDLTLKFEARDHEVLLKSDYGFLKARMNLDFVNPRITDSTGKEFTPGARKMTPSDWVGFDGSLDGKQAGLLLLNHKSNPGPKPSADGSCSLRDTLADEGDLFAWIGLNPIREAALLLAPDAPLHFRVRVVIADRKLSEGFCRHQWETFNADIDIRGLSNA